MTGVPVAYHSASRTHHPFFDSRFNLLGLTDESGNLIETYRYTPFGLPEIFDATGTKILTSSFGMEPVFGGQRFLSSTGLYLSKRRLMNPINGIFLSTDPQGYADSPSLYVYVAQNPIDLIDPEGELAFLAGLAIAAIVGAVVSGGVNAARQGIAISEGSQEGWEWGQFGWSVGIGAVAGPLLVVAPELALPLAVYGVGNGIAGIAEGNYGTGAFDIVTSLVPFGLKGVRANTFSRGSALGRGPTAGLATRVGRIEEIGTHALYRRFYRGTTKNEVNQTIGDQSYDVATVIARQRNPNNIPPRLGEGLYFTENLKSGTFEPGTALSHARKHGFSQGDNPGILGARMFRPRFWLRARNPESGIKSRIPQAGMNNIGQQETFIPESPAQWFNQNVTWYEVHIPSNLNTGMISTGEFSSLISAAFPVIIPHPNETISSK